MNCKKWMVVILLIVMLLSVCTGCKSEVPGETAAADTEVVGEDNTPEVEADLPEVNTGEPVIQQGTSNQPDPPKEEQEEEPKQEEEAPVVETDPYEVPLSKTEATTEDGITYYLENKFKVVSYNIRCANDPNGNSIEERAPRLEEVINKYDPDLIGFQEFTTPWEMPVDFAFAEEYEYVYKYRAESNLEATPVLFKRSKFKLLDSGTYWLSETPEKESKGWGADHYRIVTWVKLEVRQTGKVLYFCSTHFDFTDDPQVNSANLIIDRVKGEYKNAPTIVVGDFNMTKQSKGYAAMTAYFTDANVKNDPAKTYTGYGEAKSLIDFIFVTGKHIKPVDYKVMDDKPDGNFASDHFGVYSEVIIL
ncbi:MAG: endonuclease/exonuclease/phosphatase family protein [Clostridia bacterium]|nr:endonuclease/exonuclease/phosphatase family protein [Clostridia bacterium]